MRDDVRFALHHIAFMIFSYTVIYHLLRLYDSVLSPLFSMSHRERVEQFNEKLGKLTELNDIPRVSAAGNG